MSMAAYNEDIQRDLSEAQQCKCENGCRDYLKLQSELNEEGMELKSVKEIVNILKRDVASINVRVHNLCEQESPHTVTQPFENWPLRHSTKKGYCEMTAYKPYTVTNNRFQLLDNFQENDSPEDVLSEISQPGKDYGSAVKVRSARVKGDHQATKDIDKTHYHNANFNNPDTKNITIPVIVKGQASTSKNNPVNRQNSKFSHKKVLIIGDRHARLCATNIKSEIRDNYDVQGLVKPGAEAGTLVNTVNSYIANLTKIYVVIFCGGVNDVAKNNSKMALRHIRNFTKLNNHTNIILVNAAHRYDLMQFSYVNIEIRSFNRKLMRSATCTNLGNE